MWLFFAILAPVLYGTVHILDSHCVEEIFDEPFVGMITSAVATVIIVSGLIPFVAPLIDLNWSWNSPMILFSILSGALVMTSQGLYFKALSFSEAGIVAAYWNMIPVFVPIGSFIVFKEILEVPQYFGIAILIGTSVIFCLIDSQIRYRWNTLLLMVIASILQACSYLLDEKIFTVLPFLQAFFLMTIGYSLTGMLPLLLPRNYTATTKNLPLLLPAIKLFLLIETLDLLGLMSAERAIDLGVPSLVSALEGTIPAFTFLLSLVFLALLPKYVDKKTLANFGTKCGLVGWMVLGIILLN